MEMSVAKCPQPRRIDIIRKAVERPGDLEVLVKVAYCGVCPSDLRIYQGKSTSVRYPIELGHEVSGVVEEVGTQVEKLTPGDRVSVDVIRRCGSCAHCKRGLENHCENLDWSRGGYAEYLLAPAENVYRLQGSTGLLESALVEPLACVLRGQRRVHVATKDTVLVSGVGPLGLLHLQALKAIGARVIVTDYSAERLRVARLLGADAVVNPAGEKLEEAVAGFTHGFGVDVAIIANSQIEAVHQALPLLAIAGRLLLFAGIYPTSELTLDPNTIHYREIMVTGSSDYVSSDYADALQYIEAGKLNLSALISDVIPLERLEKAFSLVEGGERLKVVVACNILEPLEMEDPKYELLSEWEAKTNTAAVPS